MNLVSILFAVTVALLSRQYEARSMFMCELVHELRGQGFPENLMRDWVCLVEHESARTTHKVGRKNRDGSRDYGLFQINDNFWCSNTTTPGKDCNVTCADVITDDITKAATCAKKIYKRHKFRAWYGWLNHCDGKQLPDISHC